MAVSIMQATNNDKSHQRIIREGKGNGSIVSRQYSFTSDPTEVDLKNAEIRAIDYKTASTIILEYEWIGTMPLPKSCRYMFGIYFENVLGGAVVYVEPSTRQFIEKYPRQVVQLNRGACSHWTPKNTASKLIGRSSRLLKQEGIKAIIAYCTKEAGEIGTIYQACNFLYVGETAPSKVYWLDNHWVSERTLADKKAWAKNKGDDWVNKFDNLNTMLLAGKYRYILPLGNKYERVKFMEEYDFQSRPYPKRDTHD